MNWMEEVLTAHIHQGSPVPTSQTCCSHKRSTLLVLTAMRLLFWRLFQVGLKCHVILWRSFSGSHADILDRTVVVDELNELVKIKKKMARGVWMSFTFLARIFTSRCYSFHKTIVVSMKWMKVFFFWQRVYLYHRLLLRPLSADKFIRYILLLRWRQRRLALHTGETEPACLAWLRYTKRNDNPDIAQTIRRKLVVAFWGGFNGFPPLLKVALEFVLHMFL